MVRNGFIFFNYEEHEEKLSLCFRWPLGSRQHLKPFNGLNDKVPGD